MRQKIAAVAATTVIAVSGVLTVVAAESAFAAAPNNPIPYADCIKDVKKQHGAKKSPQAHCHMLVKKGWVKKPGT